MINMNKCICQKGLDSDFLPEKKKILIVLINLSFLTNKIVTSYSYFPFSVVGGIFSLGYLVTSRTVIIM